MKKLKNLTINLGLTVTTLIFTVTVGEIGFRKAIIKPFSQQESKLPSITRTREIAQIIQFTNEKQHCAREREKSSLKFGKLSTQSSAQQAESRAIGAHPRFNQYTLINHTTDPIVVWCRERPILAFSWQQKSMKSLFLFLWYVVEKSQFCIDLGENKMRTLAQVIGQTVFMYLFSTGKIWVNKKLSNN